MLLWDISHLCLLHWRTSVSLFLGACRSFSFISWYIQLLSVDTSWTSTLFPNLEIRNGFEFKIAINVLYQVGIVGRTGAGKSSVLNAIFRLNPTCQGRILVDGMNIADVSVRHLRSHFAAVPQTPFLFEGSLRYIYSLLAHSTSRGRYVNKTNRKNCKSHVSNFKAKRKHSLEKKKVTNLNT